MQSYFPLRDLLLRYLILREPALLLLFAVLITGSWKLCIPGMWYIPRLLSSKMYN